MSAVLSHDFARSRGGRFLLRIEDIDAGRAREEFVTGIEEDLRWLGLAWDGAVVRQSQRLPLYADALDRLKAMELVYPCFCTRADIARSTSAPHGPEGPLYPGTCRALAGADLTRPHAWRLDIAKAVAAAGPLTWRDHGREIVARPGLLGDVVLARKDAPVSYHLAVTIDDAEQDVTHVIRGRDLYLSTHVHRLLQALLGLPTPVYRHHVLVCGPDVKRLAKRDAAAALASLRDSGVDGPALAADLLAQRLPAGYSLQIP